MRGEGEYKVEDCEKEGVLKVYRGRRIRGNGRGGVVKEEEKRRGGVDHGPRTKNMRKRGGEKRRREGEGDH